MPDGQLSASEMPDIAISGQQYSLAHLKSFTLPVVINEQTGLTYKVYVSFGTHTFSKTWDDTDLSDHKVDDGREVRCFCPVRHGHSLSLPDIIRKGVSGRAYFSQRKDFLLIDNLPGMVGPYAVFFNLEKAKTRNFHAAMFVVSAYEKPDLPLVSSLQRITFNTLLAKTVRGEKIIRPKK